MPNVIPKKTQSDSKSPSCANSDQNPRQKQHVPRKTQQDPQQCNLIARHYALSSVNRARCRAACAIGAAMDDPLPPCSTTTDTA